MSQIRLQIGGDDVQNVEHDDPLGLRRQLLAPGVVVPDVIAAWRLCRTERLLDVFTDIPLINRNAQMFE